MNRQMHKYENLLNRQFHAQRLNSKWVTDIAYIDTKQDVLYLSIIQDLYNNNIVAYNTGTHQTVNLVLDTIGDKENPIQCTCKATKTSPYTSHLLLFFSK